MTLAASEGRRIVLEIAVVMIVVTCLATGFAITILSLFGPGIERLGRGLVRVPEVEHLLHDPHWRASPPAAGSAASPSPHAAAD